MKQEEFIKILKLLGASYNKEFDQEQAEVWYSFLKNYQYSELLEATKNIISKNKYLPSIAEIKEEIAHLQMKDIPRAEDEWQEVINAVYKFGERIGEVEKYLKPYTYAMMRKVGYGIICNASPEEQIWNKNRFIEYYNDYLQIEKENIQIGAEERTFLTNNTMLLEEK